MEDVTPLTDGDDVANMAAEANVAKAGYMAKSSNVAQENTAEDEEKVIEIDEYTRKMTIIQEHIYHYVGLMSGREYAKEMGMETQVDGIPQMPMEFLLQEIKKRKSQSASIQPDQTTTEHSRNTEPMKRSPEHSEFSDSSSISLPLMFPSSEKRLEKELAEDKDEALVKNSEYKTRMKHFEREDSSTETERNNNDETEHTVERDKGLQNNSKKSKNDIGDNLVQERSGIFSDSDQIPRNKNDLNFDQDDLAPILSMDEAPLESTRSADSCSDPDRNSSLQKNNKSAEQVKLIRQDANTPAPSRKLSSDVEDTLNSNRDIVNERFTAESKVNVKATDPAINGYSTQQLAKVGPLYLPSVEHVITRGESEQNEKSDSKPVYSTMMIVGPKRTNTSQPNRKNSKQKIGADNNENNIDLTDSRSTLRDAVRQDGVTRAHSSKLPAMTPDLESNDTADAEVREKIGKLTERESGSYLKPTEKQIISTIYVVPNRRNTKDFENTSTPADCSVTNEKNLLRMMSRDSTSSPDNGSCDDVNDDDRTLSGRKTANSFKSTNSGRTMNATRLEEVDSIVDDFDEQLPEDVTWKKPYSPSQNQLINEEGKESDDSSMKRQNFDDDKDVDIDYLNDPALIVDTSVISSTNRMRCELVPSDDTTAPNRKAPSTEGRTTEATVLDVSSSAETGNDVTGQNSDVRNFVRQNENSIEEESVEATKDKIRDFHSLETTENTADETKTEKRTRRNTFTADNYSSDDKYKDSYLEMSSENRSENMFHSDESGDISSSNEIEPIEIDAVTLSPLLDTVRNVHDGEVDPKNKEIPLANERFESASLDAEIDTTEHNEKAYVDSHTTQNTENEDTEREQNRPSENNFDASIDAPLETAIKLKRQNADLYAAVPVNTNANVQTERTVDDHSTIQGAFHDEVRMNQPDGGAAQRVVSLCDSFTQTSEAGDDAAPLPKTKSLSRSRSVGFRDPEVIPDVRPTRVCVPITPTSIKTPVRSPGVDRKTKIPLVARKSFPQATTVKESTVEEKKAAVTRKETPKKTPSKTVANSPSTRPKTLHVPRITTKSTTGSTGHGSSGPPVTPKVVPSPKVTRKKEESKSTPLQKRSPPSKSMECIPRCTCLQISGKTNFAKSISNADPEKYGTMSKQKSCEALHATRHPDNPLGLREYGFYPPSKRPHWK